MQVAGIDGPPEILRVRAAHAFGQAGGAGGVEDRERVARLDRVRRQAFLRRREGQAAEAVDSSSTSFADQPQGFERKAAAIESRNDRREFTLDHHQSRTAIAQDVFQLCATRRDIDGNRDGAKPAAAQYREQKLGPVAAHDGDAVAGLDAGRSERSGIPGRSLACLGVGERHAADRNQPALPVALGLAQQHAGHGPLRRREELLERQGLCSTGRCGREYRHDHPSWREFH